MTQAVSIRSDIYNLLPAVTTLILEVNGGSRYTYRGDSFTFLLWLMENGIDLAGIDYITMLRYKNHLLDAYAKSTAMKRFIVARRVLQTAVRLKIIDENPAIDIKTQLRPEDSSPHTALSKREARRLLASVDRSTTVGKRNYAIIMTLLFTGVRRSECCAINIGDIVSKSEHKVLIVKHGKGNKKREIPLRPDVFRAVQAYIEAADRLNEPLDAPLFIAFYQNSKQSSRRMSDKAVEHLVKEHGQKIGLQITPHDLRASFITYAVDTGKPIIQVQR